jgi:hypothetical protein
MAWLIDILEDETAALGDPVEERIEQGCAELPPSLAERVRLEVMDAIELDVPRQSGVLGRRTHPRSE